MAREGIGKGAICHSRIEPIVDLEYGGRNKSVMLLGHFTFSDTYQPARSRVSSTCTMSAVGVERTCSLSHLRCRSIMSMSRYGDHYRPALARRRARCRKQVHPVVLGLTDYAGTRTASGPAVRERALLSVAHLVLEPHFDDQPRILMLEASDK